MSETRSVTLGGVACGVTVHSPAPGTDRHVGLLYLHGGGLLYGERDDLPEPYVGLLRDSGYTLACLDYPLAPETPLPGICAAVLEGWRWFVGSLMPELGLRRHLLFGRSSGAYLALVLARDARRAGLGPQPCGIVDLYGYHDLLDPALCSPVPAYAALPAVGGQTVAALTSGSTVSSGPKALRYALYVRARQTGSWLEMLGASEPVARERSLSAEDVAALPPLFVAASTGDEDVPYRIPKSLFRTKPGTRMVTAYGLPHDFDRDVANPEGMRAYREMVAWMDAL